eukprot:11213853-Lingulodinium_polyedra.AAC.1
MKSISAASSVRGHRWPMLGAAWKCILLGTGGDKVAGCVELNRVCFSEGSRSSEVHDSSTSWRQGEHEEHWKSLQKSFDATTRKRKEAEGETHP